MRSFTLAQVLVAVGVIFLIGTIVPSLLDAKSDISIFIGVCIVVSVFYCLVRYGKLVSKWLGFDFNENERED